MAKVPSSLVDTAQVARHQRFGLWRDALAATHEVTLPEGADAHDFNASARSHHLGDKLVVLESRATPQRLQRTPRAVRSDQIDHYLIRLQRAGRWAGDLDGRAVVADAGTVMVLDMARPSVAATTDIDNLNLVVPREALDDLMPAFDMHGLVLQGGMAALLRCHLSELATHLPSFAAADARRLADATLSLVAACIAPSRGALARARAPLKAAVLAEVRRHIDRHLHYPELTPQSVSQALGLPRSTLYAVCESVGGVAAFIQRRRLRRIHSILIDPREQRRIADIAHQYGFTNEAHFSRAFRRAFGYSPREARQTGAQNLPDGGSATPVRDAYQTWMRRLGA